MASTTTEQNDLTGFNWDDNADTFFNISPQGEETQETTEEVTETEAETETEEIDEDKNKAKPAKKATTTETEEEDSFFGTKDSEEEDEQSEGGESESGSIYEDVYKDLKAAGIFKHVELEEGEVLDSDRLYELQQEEIEAEVAARLETWATEDLDEDAKAFIKFKLKGGDTAEFLKTYSSGAELGLGDISDEDYQDKVIRAQLQKDGWDSEEIEDRLEYLTESGKKEKTAEKYFSKLQKEIEANKAALEEQAANQKIQAKEQEEKFKTSIKAVLETSKDIKGVKISDKDKGTILNFLTKKDQKIDDKRSVTGFQKKLSEVFNDPDKIVLLAKLVNDDFDFSAFEKSVATKKTKEIKNNIDKRQSVRPSGSGSSSAGSALANLFEK